jgi:hypothetical protein
MAKRDAVSILAKIIVAVMTLFVVYACTTDMQARDPEAFLKVP